MAKRASVELIRARTVHPGKYFVLIRGGVDEVSESVKAGVDSGGDALIDHLVLPYPHQELSDVLDGPRDPRLDAVGVLETYSIASIIRGADAALKAAEISARSIRLADDLGGKGCFVFFGQLHDVQEAMSAGAAAVGDGLLAGNEIIANPHPDLIDALG